MNPAKKYVYAWVTAHWLLLIPAVLGFSYLFFSDVHGLPTFGFFVTSIMIIVIDTLGFVAAVRALRSWQES